MISIIAVVIFSSYLIAKQQAQKVAQSHPSSLSDFSTQLALFGSPELTPCWVFSADYAELMTGCTFDVYVSFYGKVLKVPPYSKNPQKI